MRGVWTNEAVRKMFIFFIMAVVVMSGLIVNGKEAAACDFGSRIIEPRPDSNVFAGKVLEIRDVHSGQEVFFEVYKVEQGNVKALTKIWTLLGKDSCGGFDFKVGGEYYVITINTSIIPSKNVVFINSARPILPEEKIEKESIEGQALLDNFKKRIDVTVAINAEELVVNRPHDYFYANKDNRIMVPSTEAFMSRFGIEGATINEDDESITLSYGEREYTFQVGRNNVLIGEEVVVMDTVTERYDGITFIPARQVADIIDAKLTWDNKDKKLSFIY